MSSTSVYGYTYACIYALHIRMYAHIPKHSTQQAYIHVYTFTYVHMCIYTYRYTYACIYALHIRMYAHIAYFVFLSIFCFPKIEKNREKNVAKK